MNIGGKNLRADYIPYHQLVKAVDPTASLSAATEGKLTRSARFRNVLSPAGFTDELRAALMYKGACWGYLTLYRRFGQPLFTEEERVFLSSLVPVIALRLRQSSFAMPEKVETEPETEIGILVLDERLRILSINGTAERWLARLREWENIERDTLRFMAEACELSAREKQILHALIKGMSTKALAQSLHISAYTVQDHIKSIFLKTGVTSRGELIWRLFSSFGAG